MSELATKNKEPLIDSPIPTDPAPLRSHYETHTFWLLWKLQFLMRGKSAVRVGVVNFLTMLVNAQITASSSESLAPLFFGMGKCVKFSKEQPSDPWSCKELPIKEAVPSYTEFPGLCRS